MGRWHAEKNLQRCVVGVAGSSQKSWCFLDKRSDNQVLSQEKALRVIWTAPGVAGYSVGQLMGKDNSTLGPGGESLQVLRPWTQLPQEPWGLLSINAVSCITRSQPTWVCVLSHVWLFATSWTAACQALLSMGFPRQEYCSVFPFPPSGDLPHPGVELRDPGINPHCRWILSFKAPGKNVNQSSSVET